MMNQRNAQQYKEQMINTMTQGELLLLLYDELVKRMTQAELALEKKNYEILDDAVQRSLRIVEYLDDTLDTRYAISHDLTRLYEYLSYELRRVQIGRRIEVLTHAKKMAEELRDAFRTAQKSADSSK